MVMSSIQRINQNKQSKRIDRHKTGQSMWFARSFAMFAMFGTDLKVDTQRSLYLEQFTDCANMARINKVNMIQM